MGVSHPPLILAVIFSSTPHWRQLQLEEAQPVDQYIERYGIEDVYCYGSDYPHLEGGKDPMARFAARLERLGPTIMEKFFVKNGTYLLPP
jgi:hypothetical protein